MNQILNETKIEITEKKSKFITRVINIQTEEEAKNNIADIVKLEKGAVHNCYAYRILDETKNIIERKNDDGEPGGTAGAPMLSVLTGEGMINTLAVTTRYFGGIKLGTGGLVNVYKKGVQEALKKSGKKEFESYVEYKICFKVNKTDQVQYVINKEKILIKDKKFNNKDVEFIIDVPESSIDRLENIAKLTGGEIYRLHTR